MKKFLQTFTLKSVGIIALASLGFLLAPDDLSAQQVTDPAISIPGYADQKAQGASRATAPISYEKPDIKSAGNSGRMASKASTSGADPSEILSNCFIPRDGSYTAVPRNDDGSYGPIALPFTFDLYGTSYTEVWINTNGNLTFTGPYSAFSASGFPFSMPMVAPLWGDVDTRAGGEIFYKLSPTNLIVTWDGVGYYSYSTDKLNTFQAIIGSNSDPLTGIGQNVSLRYGDMQWTTGSASGGFSGFGGTPATVGINHGNGTDYVQIGRFNQNNSNYDGPGGSDDGVNYLDGQCFSFNVSSAGNIPPSASGLPANNVLNLTCGQTATISPQFLAPEVNQSVTVSVNTGGLCGTTVSTNNGTTATATVSITASACNTGTHQITFTATDNGNPAETTTSVVTVNIGSCCNLQASATANNESCPGAANGNINLSVTNYTAPLSFNWSNGATIEDPASLAPGMYTVTVTDANGCTATASATVGTNADTTPPNISCPFNIETFAGPNSCGAVVNYNQPSATDNCGGGAMSTTLAGFTYKGTFGGHTYFLSNGTATPEAAHAAAIAQGGHLVTIGSAAENSFVSAMSSSFIWIGFTDRDAEGQFKWVTSEPVVYTNWNGGEPNNYGGNEDWAVINWGPNGTWNDWFYYQNAYYVVEFDGGSIPATLVSGPASGSEFPVGTTTVTYSATDASGNTASCNFTVTVIDNAAPTITCGSDITLTAQPGDCTPMVTWNEPTAADNCAFTVSSSHTSGDRFPIGTTTVSYTVTDASNLSATCSFTVTVNPAPLVITDLSSPTFNGFNISCNGGYNGSATATVDGGCLPYTYAWSNGQTGATATSLVAGTYSVIVTDANGTSVQQSITLTEPTLLSVSGTVSPAVAYTGAQVNTIYLGYGPQSRTLTATEAGGVAGYSFAWSPATGLSSTTGASVIASPTVTTSYTVTVTDANGCTAMQVHEIIVINAVCSNNANNYKVLVCHEGQTICVSENAVATHLAHGCTVGPCGPARVMAHPEVAQPTLFAYPNPNNGNFTLEVEASAAGQLVLDLVDVTGRSLGQLFCGSLEAGQKQVVEVNKAGIPSGIYLVRMQSQGKVTNLRVAIHP